MADNGYLQDHGDLEIAVTVDGRLFDTLDRRTLSEMMEIHLDADGALRGWGEGMSFIADNIDALRAIHGAA